MTHHAQLVFVCVHVCAGTHVCLGVCGGQKTTFVVVLQLFSTLFCFGFCSFFPFFFKDKNLSLALLSDNPVSPPIP